MPETLPEGCWVRWERLPLVPPPGGPAATGANGTGGTKGGGTKAGGARKEEGGAVEAAGVERMAGGTNTGPGCCAVRSGGARREGPTEFDARMGRGGSPAVSARIVLRAGMVGSPNACLRVVDWAPSSCDSGCSPRSCSNWSKVLTTNWEAAVAFLLPRPPPR